MGANIGRTAVNGWVAGPPQTVTGPARDDDAMDVDTDYNVPARNTAAVNPFLQQPAILPHLAISPSQPFASFVPLACLSRPVPTIQPPFNSTWSKSFQRPIWDCFRPPSPDLWLESDITCKGCLNLNVRCSANDLPQELTDLVLEHVEDRATLGACTLVCKSWSAWSSRLYFRTFKVTRPVASALYEYLQLADRARENIHHLTLEGVDRWAGGRMYGSHSGASDREIVAQTFAVEELLTVLKLIPQLKSLELRSLPVYRDMWTLPLVGWPADFHPTTPNPQSLRDARLSLESLRLFNMASFVADPSCLQAFLTIFERIDDLQFTDCQVPNYNRPIGRDITYWVPFEMMRHAPLQTKRLTISTFRSSSFLAMFNLFSGIVDGAGIEYLELDPTDGGLRSYTNDAASAYMARLTGLKELILRIPCHRIENWNSQFITLPSLAPLHNLRKVSVYDLPVHSVEERRGLTNLPALRVIADSIFNEVYALLESARRATLTHVHLGFETMGTVLHARTATSHLRTTFVKNHWHRFLGARCFAADAFQELSLDGIWSTEWSKATLRGSAEIRAVAGKLIPQ